MLKNDDYRGKNFLDLWKAIIEKSPLEVLINIDKDLNENYLRDSPSGQMHRAVKERINDLNNHFRLQTTVLDE